MKHINKKLTEQEVVEIEELLQKGFSTAQIMRRTGFSDRLNDPPKMVHRSTEKQR